MLNLDRPLSVLIHRFPCSSGNKTVDRIVTKSVMRVKTGECFVFMIEPV